MYIFFDLDKTLFVQDEHCMYAKCFAKKSNLTKQHDQTMGDVYFIYLEETKALLQWLFKNIKHEIYIGFATSSKRAPEYVIPVLAKAFCLPDGWLHSCIYFNKASHYQNPKISKAEYIANLKLEDEIVLVDDCDKQLKAAEELEYHTIKATGWDNEPKYLEEIKDKVSEYIEQRSSSKKRKTLSCAPN